jgi:hypothetical protein
LACRRGVGSREGSWLVGGEKAPGKGVGLQEGSRRQGRELAGREEASRRRKAIE